MYGRADWNDCFPVDGRPSHADLSVLRWLPSSFHEDMVAMKKNAGKVNCSEKKGDVVELIGAKMFVFVRHPQYLKVPFCA